MFSVCQAQTLTTIVYSESAECAAKKSIAADIKWPADPCNLSTCGAAVTGVERALRSRGEFAGPHREYEMVLCPRNA